ncbi:MAG: efflux RND transporter periplasmic adaptor subunit [Acidobacteria bacterium]|nr:efflux RND transporter periplasmic adaptor subunit [Acidobacteriota bacterium]
MRMFRTLPLIFLGLSAVLMVSACGSKSDANGPASHGGRGAARHGSPAGRDGRAPAAAPAAAVPVRVVPVVRRDVSSYLETNGVLEAENEVDVVARIAGPITELEAEEGMKVKKGTLLARIDDREAKAEADVASVNRDEAKLAFDRTKTSYEQQLVSREAYDSALSKLKATEAQFESAQLKLDYTHIRAPFDGLVVKRYVKLAANVSVNTPLFRVSNFTPLLCPIQVPEKELSNLRVGQRAVLHVDAYGDDPFPASVLRISPVVDPSTGTLTVTLQANARDKLRPGMFASVALETAVHHDALVIPKSSLVLDSLGDTVYIKDGGVARRREVKLGFREGSAVEVLGGLEEGNDVIVLGQEGLSDGTPVATATEQRTAQTGSEGPTVAEAGARGAPGSQELEAMKQRMRDRGMSDQEIEQRIQRVRGGQPSQRAGGTTQAPALPPRLLERLRNASPQELESIKQRMRDRGMTAEQVEAAVRTARGGAGE